MSHAPEHPSATDSTRPSQRAGLDKPRNPLPLTVQGERGLREGEVWRADHQHIHFFSSERLAPRRMYEARVDPRGHGENVDMMVKIDDVTVVNKSGVKLGYLHKARFRCKRSQDAKRLLQAFTRHNPDHAESAQPTAAPTPQRPAAAPQTAAPPPTREAAGKPSPTRAQPGKPSARATKPRRSAPKPSHGVIPQIGPGTPPAVLLQFEDFSTLRTHLRIEQGDLFLSAAPTAGLQEGQGVTLHLQLPTGRFITVLGRVGTSTDRHCSFIARRVDAACLNTLNAALRIAAEGGR
jgi:hypothetical protein